MSTVSAPVTAAPATSDTATASSPPASGYQIPGLGWRILGGGLRLVPTIVFLVLLPVGLLSFLSDHGIQGPIPLSIIVLFGALLAVLYCLRYILKPTAAYGPVAIATAAAVLAYLYLIFVTATYALTIPGTGATISVDYTRLILVLMIGPALAATAGVLTLIEDVGHPKERLPFDYPA